MTTPTLMRASLLVLDWSLYPRHKLDEVNIRSLRQAREAGEDLPPVHIDQNSKRVIDGFHRVTMVLRSDPDGEIAVTKSRYRDDTEMFLDAVRRNARHGARLQPYDKARCVNLAAELHVDDDALADALGVSVDITAKIRASRTGYDPDGKPLELKRPLRAHAGRKLTHKQVNANEHSSGWSARFHAEQILLLLDADLVDWDDDATRTALTILAATLAEHAETVT